MKEAALETEQLSAILTIFLCSEKDEKDDRAYRKEFKNST